LMRGLGLVARADDRGLGHICWDFATHMDPERVLVVREPGSERRGFRPHLDRYPGGTVVTCVEGALPEEEVRAWLAGLAVVYGAETWYDRRFGGWAEDARVATVLHAMPEFYRAEMASTQVWAPTPWRLDLLPPGAPVIPVPVAASPLAPRSTDPEGRLRFLHVAGHRAAGDRNGTQALSQVVKRLEPWSSSVRIEGQDRRLAPVARRRGMDVQVRLGGRVDRWAMYDDADVLVMPRRYGGLCLPVQEAMAAGVAVVMTDWPPNDWWPTLRCEAEGGPSMMTPGGMVATCLPNLESLATTMRGLVRCPEAVADLQQQSLAWAAGHSWTVWRPMYEQHLAAAVERPVSRFSK